MKAVLFDLFETLITERENGKNVMDFGTPECECPAHLLGINEVEFEREWVLDALKGLKNKGLKIGLVSNCSAEEIDGLFSCPLMHFIDEIVLSFQVGVSKPSREIYSLVCDRVDIKPAECIFVGDGGANELVGATNAGIKAYQATWFHNRVDIGEDFQKLVHPKDLVALV